MSKNITAAIQSRIDRRANFLRSAEDERAAIKAIIKICPRRKDIPEDDVEGLYQLEQRLKLYHYKRAEIKAVALDQKLDKMILRNITDARREVSMLNAQINFLVNH